MNKCSYNSVKAEELGFTCRTSAVYHVNIIRSVEAKKQSARSPNVLLMMHSIKLGIHSFQRRLFFFL